MPVSPNRYTVHVVDRGLDILELLRDVNQPLGLAEISRRLGMVKSSSYRLLCTLERRGYVERVGADGRYHLGAGLMNFVARPLAQRVLVETARPYMERLLKRFGETVNLGVLRDGQILYLEMLESPHPLRMAAKVGSSSPVHSTALGKAIGAYLTPENVDEIVRTRGLPPLTSRTMTSAMVWKRELARVRARGYAEDNGETEPEASCIGAPIFGADSRVSSAISLSGPTSRIRAIKPAATQAVLEACRSISRSLQQHVAGKIVARH